MTSSKRNSRRWPYLLITVFFVAIISPIIGYLLLGRRRRAKPRPSSEPRYRPYAVDFVTQITGLTEAEAAARQIPIDEEALAKAKQRRFRRALVRQHLFTFFNLDMIGAAIAMYLLGSAWSAFLSLLILVLSFGLNVFQELYTKRKLDVMIAELQPQVTVIRESRVRSIPLKMIAPGDMVVVGLGDRILVDGEVVSEGHMVVDEAAAAGGLERRVKQAGDEVYAGSICVEGQAVYRVTDVELLQTVLAQGLETSLLPDKPTPLQQLIESIFKILFVLVLIFNVLLFMDLGATWLGLAVFDGVLARDIVSQIFAIAPTSLFLIIAVSYAVGLLRIADVGALVYRSETVESSVALAGQYRIVYPGELILMVKALVTLEGVGHLVAPGIDVRTASQGAIQGIIFEQYNLGRIFKDSLLLIPELLDLLNRSPLALNESLQTLEGRLKQPQSDPLKGVQRATLAGFCLIAGAILVAFDGPWPLPVALFLIAFVLAINS